MKMYIENLPKMTEETGHQLFNQYTSSGVKQGFCTPPVLFSLSNSQFKAIFIFVQ